MFKLRLWSGPMGFAIVLAAVVGVSAAALFSQAVLHSVRFRRPDLEITGTWWAQQPLKYGVRAIEGRVRNNSGHFYSEVFVDFDLMDSRGAALGSHRLTIHGLHRGESREFSTWLLANRPARYRIRGVQGV